MAVNVGGWYAGVNSYSSDGLIHVALASMYSLFSRTQSFSILASILFLSKTFLSPFLFVRKLQRMAAVDLEQVLPSFYTKSGKATGRRESNFILSSGKKKQNYNTSIVKSDFLADICLFAASLQVLMNQCLIFVLRKDQLSVKGLSVEKLNL